jgi:hypothetical protein
VAVGANADGRLEVMAVGGNGWLYDYYETVTKEWSGWQFVAKGILTGAPILANNQDGRMEVFAVGTDGGLYHTYQTEANGAWVASTAYIGAESPIDSFSVSKLADGRLALVVGHQQNCYCTFLSQPKANSLTSSQLDKQPPVTCAPPAPTVKIVTFKASANSITPGLSAALEYDVVANTSCNPLQFDITAQVGAGAPTPVNITGASPSSGSIEVSPTQPTTYTLTVKCSPNGPRAAAQTSIGITAPQAVINFANSDPTFEPIEFPPADTPFSGVVHVVNSGNAPSISFTVVCSVNGDDYSTGPSTVLNPGQTSTVTTKFGGFDAGNIVDFEWRIPQYGNKNVFQQLTF